MKGKILILLILGCVILSAYGQEMNYIGEEFYQYSSSALLGTSSTFASDVVPDVSNINPASTASEQRTSLSLYYTGGFSPSGYGLNGFSSGASFPSRFAVFSIYLSYIGSGLDEIDLGSTFSLSFSASKEIFDDLNFGVSVKTIMGTADVYDFGLLSDIGFLWFLRDNDIFKKSRVGFVVSGIGKGYQPINNGESIPPLYTPVLTFDSFIIENNIISLKWANSLSFPFFQNAVLKSGVGIGISDIFRFDTGYTLNLRELLDASASVKHILPSVGISFSFPIDFKQEKGLLADYGWNKSEISPRFSLLPLSNDVWIFSTGFNLPLGVIDSDSPEVTVELDDITYISPNNDGINDYLEFPFGIKDQRYVINYSLKIENENGKIIRTIENKEERPQDKNLKTFFQQLLKPKEGVPIPDKLRWDGITDNGDIAEDGKYYVYVTASDDNGNITITDKKLIILDKTFPEISISVESEDAKIFSPNNDGLKDTIKILQKGSEEELWIGKIIDQNGNIKKEFFWRDASPSDVEWDGRDNNGVLCTDGIYTYTMSSTDKAGNSITKEIDNIIISTEPTPVGITVNSKYFSPNGDGISDNLKFDLDVPVIKGIVNWKLEIFTDDNQLKYKKEDKSIPPSSIIFDGKDINGNLMPEGGYVAKLTVRYQNGNSPTASTSVFYLDITPPSVSVNIPDPIFSPNSDGRKDELIIRHSNSSREDRWIGEIFTDKDQKVRTFVWNNFPPGELQWNGITDGTGLALDGRYYYIVKSTDGAGNSFTSEPVFFSLSTEKTPVLLSVNYDTFSPNSDGNKDTISFYPQLKTQQMVDKYELIIRDIEGINVKAFAGNKIVPGQIIWDGKDNNGNVVEEGKYFAQLNVYYSNGNIENAKVDNIVVDITPPVVDLKVENKIFSPNNDGKKDYCIFNQSSNENATWKAFIISKENNNKIIEKEWTGKLESFSWSGKDSADNVIQYAKFYYLLEGQDKAGNKTSIKVDNIVVDIRPIKVFVTVKEKAFSPNSDGVLDTQTITIYTEPADAVESWSLELINNGVIEKTYTGKTQESVMKITWNGLNSNGKISDGIYTARYTVVFSRGETIQENSKTFIVDTTAPELEINVSPVPFSPDNDGIDDEVFFTISTSDLSGIVSWDIAIQDPYGNPFTNFSGKGTPAPQIIWDGRSKTGELVSSAEDYNLIFSALDAVGNTSVVKTIVPVDVLVIREGNRLKIKISSIYFEPNSSVLVMDDSEEGMKNKKIIEKLVKIFNKYGNYKIKIEGHAVNISGTEREEVEELIPLSLKRADSVKNALVSMGLNEQRITIAGIGGKEPLVPHTDIKNRWKNRRVEFILIKE
ncbi:OmpA family protein [Spirochaetia bacterium 38H-sp]|uniref:OmpA family protein n=1 Tax=Rarispira pelagica TaxID=3141764 RepID=A0ABU9UC54_9SPIR